MAGWKLKRGNPEWHEVMQYRETLRDGTCIEAYTEDCDGDFVNWGVKENGIIIAAGTERYFDVAREKAEKAIVFGLVPR